MEPALLIEYGKPDSDGNIFLPGCFKMQAKIKVKPVRMGNNNMLQLGKKAKDKITGHEGILTGRASYITGCDQYLVQPPAKDGEFKNGTWIDEGRLEITGEGVKVESVKAEENGGPACNAPIK